MVDITRAAHSLTCPLINLHQDMACWFLFFKKCLNVVRGSMALQASGNIPKYSTYLFNCLIEKENKMGQSYLLTPMLEKGSLEYLMFSSSSPLSFVPCSERIHVAVREMAILFPKVSWDDQLRHSSFVCKSQRVFCLVNMDGKWMSCILGQLVFCC